jgi:hypothetical protein
MDLVDKQIGAEDQVKVSLEGKKLVITNSYAGKQMSADVVIKIDAQALGEQLKQLFPGKVDDLVIDIIEGALP